ncbi:cold-shock protein [Reichenbachiella carrageenanivorans]|uniref:Cold-shock protein n=1 Tax=Reichenbachiella carrageenanivorans TaxID=2979869 RepID=A0ABY6CXI0_9BACT|nr:cold-shock protein [Reichenbachiella carrageenanivorans]UXX78429.1 cold-shock protein [Reichenbachiella carrageenanivorans]
MSKSQNSFIKNQKAKKKMLKKKEKEERRKERQENNNKGGELSDMMAYVDEYGNILSEPPEPKIEKKKDERAAPLKRHERAERTERTELK